jgi:hypothetical protein
MKTGLRPVSLQSCEEWCLICKWRHVLLPERHQRGGFRESLATFQNTQWTLLPQPPVAWHVFADHNLADGHADCAVVRDVGQVKETFRELHN